MKKIILLAILIIGYSHQTINAQQSNINENQNLSNSSEPVWLIKYNELKVKNEVNIKNIDAIVTIIREAFNDKKLPIITKLLTSDFDVSFDEMDDEKLNKLLYLKRYFSDPSDVLRKNINQALIKYYQQIITNTSLSIEEQIKLKSTHNFRALELGEFFIAYNNYDSARNIFFYDTTSKDGSSKQDLIEKINRDLAQKLQWEVNKLHQQGKYDQIIKLPISMAQKDVYLKMLEMETSDSIKIKYIQAKASNDSLAMFRTVQQLKETFTVDVDPFYFQIDLAYQYDQNDTKEILYQAINDYFKFIQLNGSESFEFNPELSNKYESFKEQMLIDIIFKVINFRIIKLQYNDAIALCNNVLLLLPNEPNTLKLIKKLNDLKNKN